MVNTDNINHIKQQTYFFFFLIHLEFINCSVFRIFTSCLAITVSKVQIVDDFFCCVFIFLLRLNTFFLLAINVVKTKLEARILIL